MTYEENRQRLLAEFDNQLATMSSCDDCPYNSQGYIARTWQDRADHVVGPCGQQNCWLDLNR